MKNRWTIAIVFLLLVFCAIVGVFIYPRQLVAVFGEDHFLSSYLYLYGLGVPIFIFNMWLMIRLNALSFKVPGEKKWLFIFIGGLVCTYVLHTMWVLVAALLPFKG